MIENTFELLNDLVNYLSKILKQEVRNPNLSTVILRAIKSNFIMINSFFNNFYHDPGSEILITVDQSARISITLCILLSPITEIIVDLSPRQTSGFYEVKFFSF